MMSQYIISYNPVLIKESNCWEHSCFVPIFWSTEWKKDKKIVLNGANLFV